jgi:uncharacterized protein YbaA (DUF1428 family)
LTSTPYQQHTETYKIPQKEIKMSLYIDGYVVPVPKDKLDEYIKMAKLAGKVWKEYGALKVMESVADDVPEGKITSFGKSVQLKDNETVVFSYILYESRQARDEINEKVMKDPRLADMMDPKNLPFDGMRMFWGGFKPIVEL